MAIDISNRNKLNSNVNNSISQSQTYFNSISSSDNDVTVSSLNNNVRRHRSKNSFNKVLQNSRNDQSN